MIILIADWNLPLLLNASGTNTQSSNDIDAFAYSIQIKNYKIQTSSLKGALLKIPYG